MSNTPDTSTDQIPPVITTIQAQVLINTGVTDGVEAQQRLANTLTTAELQAVQARLQK